MEFVLVFVAVYCGFPLLITILNGVKVSEVLTSCLKSVSVGSDIAPVYGVFPLLITNLIGVKVSAVVNIF